MLTHLYGLRPWELDRLTFRELDVYLTRATELLQGGSSAA